MDRANSTPINTPRPASSTSVRPSSSAPLRPPSSASAVRPSSSLGITRSISRLSQRSGSRLSRRPSSRQASRITPLMQTLVTQITGITQAEDPDNFRIATDFVSRSLETSIGGSSGQDMAKMNQHFHGLARKARIQCNDDLASAIELAYKNVKNQAQKNVDLDADIKMSRLPDHLQLLILLSLPATSLTLQFAENYLENINNPPMPSPPLTWQDILAEEPFEGQHWEGVYGLPPGSTDENWESKSNDSSPSLSPWDDVSEDQGEDSLSYAGSSRSVSDEDDDASVESDNKLKGQFAVTKVVAQPYSHRDALERLKGRQYWRPEWRINADVSRPFSLGDPSTLGPSIHKVLCERQTLKLNGPETEKYINEHDAVREVLIGLHNHENLMMTLNESRDDTVSYVPSSSPRLLHLTLTSQLSVLSTFASTATALQHLRRFVSTVFNKAEESSRSEDKVLCIINLRRRNSCTLEAFADAIDSEIRQFDKWCSQMEEEICKARAGLGSPLIVSFLSLEKSIRDKFSTMFNVLMDTLRSVIKQSSARRWSHTRTELSAQTPIWNLTEVQKQVPPSVITSILLNTLLQSMQEQFSMGDFVTSDGLMRIFAKTAEPVWSMIGTWLKNGMPIHDAMLTLVPTTGVVHEVIGAIDDEFFVEDNEIGLLDPDFWSEGYTLRRNEETDGQSHNVPVFIDHVAEEILGAGKAIGLLRALGDPGLLDHETQDEDEINGVWMDSWQTFESLIATSNAPGGGGIQVATISTDELSRLVGEELHPHCLSAQEMLTRVLIEDCDLWLHLRAIEDCYLMRRGDSMSHFVDAIFAKMDSRQSWSDFHFLNTAFRDVVETSPKKWINPSLVRLSYRGSKDKAVIGTVKGIDPILVEYAVPFPLTYIFGPKAIQTYSSIFVWLVQIRRAQSALESILLRGAGTNGTYQQSDLKVFYAMRSKLSWFVNTLLSFVSTYVIHVEVLRFHGELRKAKSLDEMIQLHDIHLEKVQSRCLLLPNTSALHRAILSILDMCLHFTDCFVAFAGDTTHDISRQSLLHMKRHRSKRLKRQRRDVVGFSNTLRELRETSGDSDTDSDDETNMAPPEPSFSYAESTSISFAEESFLSRVDKMSLELDGLVRFVRRGVESLAGGSAEVAPTFGILAFNLEDWDRG